DKFNKIGPRYWVSAKIDILVGAYSNYIAITGENLGPRLKLEAFAQSSVYSKRPRTDKPRSPNDYRPITDYEPRLERDDLDYEIASSVVDILDVDGRLSCSRSSFPWFESYQAASASL